MKKNLTLILALAMIVSCIFGVMPVADSTEGGGADVESYKPEIAYANVNYSEDLVLMFAVPAPAEGALAEGSSVKLVLWETPSTVYSYKEAVSTSAGTATATAIEAEEAKVTIGGVEHLIYKYNKLDASRMTDIVYARAIVVNADGKATDYSDVLDYSVVEYAETAKGSFGDGAPIVSAGVVELLDSLLEFGAVVQGLAGDGEPYVPNGYLADDDLNKIWVTPVIAGRAKDKVFAGFFKYEEGGYATVREPFFDGYSAVAYKDADGNALTDANSALYEEALGFQIDAVDEDIEIIVEYAPNATNSFTTNDFGAGFSVNNLSKTIESSLDAKELLGFRFNSSKWGGSLRSAEAGSGLSMGFELGGEAGVDGTNFYHGIKTVADPENPDRQVFQIAATNTMMLSFGDYFDDFMKSKSGFGDTNEKALTIEMEFGKPTPDSEVYVHGLFLRDRSTWSKWSAADAYNEDGTDVKGAYDSSQTFNYVFTIINNDVVTSKGKHKICTLPDTGLVKIAVTFCEDGTLKAYYSNADGEMVLALEGPAENYMGMGAAYNEKHAQYLTNLADDNPENNDDLLPYKDIATWIEMSAIDFSMYGGVQGSKGSGSAFRKAQKAELEAAKVEINGELIPLFTTNDEGELVRNNVAYQLYVEQKYGYLFGDWKVYVGDVYK